METYKQRKPIAGFTLVELIIVIAVLGIISAYAMMRGGSPAEVSLPSQAQTLASDIRRAQTLAYTSGQRMRLTINSPTTGSYRVACITPTPPATSCATDFSVAVQKGVALAGTTTLDFISSGEPLTSASYTLTYGSQNTVCVAALTGFVKVAPPDTCP